MMHLLCGWTINRKSNIKTNFVVGVSMARVYDGRRKTKLIWQ